MHLQFASKAIYNWKFVNKNNTSVVHIYEQCACVTMSEHCCAECFLIVEHLLFHPVA
jgi:hypothetical protein